jgi:hypothetical protein
LCLLFQTNPTLQAIPKISMDIGLLDGVRSEDFMWKEFKCGLQRYIKK